MILPPPDILAPPPFLVGGGGLRGLRGGRGGRESGGGVERSPLTSRLGGHRFELVDYYYVYAFFV